LSARNWRIAISESCTGGWLGKVLSDPPGSSAWFDRALVAYSNTAKTELLGLSEELLRRHGAVSEAAVRAMATALFETSGVPLVVSVSGISGPSGGSPAKPVGTVWMGWQARGHALETRCFLFVGDRNDVRRQTVAAALQIIEDELQGR
jgi:nicotinamide-nucleotide amidase